MLAQVGQQVPERCGMEWPAVDQNQIRAVSVLPVGQLTVADVDKVMGISVVLMCVFLVWGSSFRLFRGQPRTGVFPRNYLRGKRHG